MPKGYKHVTRDIRCQLDTLKVTGLSLRAIAKQTGKNVSTISREIARNSGKRGYRFNQADRLSCERRSNASKVKKKLTADLVIKINACLIKDWSPDQTSGRLKLEGVFVSHESIYRHIWDDKRKGGELYKHLRHNGKCYNKRSSGKAGRGCIPNRVDISERPGIVEEKSRFGDFEADTIISAGSKTALMTIVDRRSKFTFMKKIGKKTASNIHKAIVEKLASFPYAVHTITYDNGMEFAAHEQISADLNAKAYFATPYCSWHRALNEHTNGLTRQYLPKKEDFKNVTDDEVQVIENKLNNRPRKVLKYKTPYELVFGVSPSADGVASRC